MYKIKLQNVSRKYTVGKSKEFYAVRNVSLIFEDTGITTVSGKSGSGKSTIINMIGGIDSPTDGQIYIDGVDITKMPKGKWCKFYKNKIAILFQSYNLLSNETVLFNVAISLMINGMKRTQAENRAKMLLDYVGLKEELFIRNLMSSELNSDVDRLVLKIGVLNSLAASRISECTS